SCLARLYAGRPPAMSIRVRPAWWVANVATPSSPARAARRSCVGPANCPPASTAPPGTERVQVRPPTRSRASTTSGRRPARRRARAATRPASPAPATATSAVSSLLRSSTSADGVVAGTAQVLARDESPEHVVGDAGDVVVVAVVGERAAPGDGA